MLSLMNEIDEYHEKRISNGFILGQGVIEVLIVP